MRKYRVIIEWPGTQPSRQYIATVSSEDDLEDLQRVYADLIARREPLVFEPGEIGEAAVILPFEGMLVMVMTDQAFKKEQDRNEARMEKARREHAYAAAQAQGAPPVPLIFKR